MHDLVLNCAMQFFRVSTQEEHVLSCYYVLQCNNSFMFLHKKNIILLCSTIQFFHVVQKEHQFTMFYNAIFSCSVKRTSFIMFYNAILFIFYKNNIILVCSAKRTSFTMFCMLCTIYNKHHCWFNILHCGE